MIEGLRGKIIKKTPEKLVVDVNGIFFSVNITLNTYRIVKPEDEITIDVDTVIGEKSIDLYGFLSEKEKSFFRSLRSISGIGPKKARALLSGLPYEEVIEAVEKGDSKLLARLPGIGLKTARKIIFELKGILPSEREMEKSPGEQQAVEALVNLGFNRKEASDVVAEIARNYDDLEEILKESLKKLVKV